MIFGYGVNIIFLLYDAWCTTHIQRHKVTPQWSSTFQGAKYECFVFLKCLLLPISFSLLSWWYLITLSYPSSASACRPTQTPPCWTADIYNSPCCAGAGGETLTRTCKLTTSYRAEQRLPSKSKDGCVGVYLREERNQGMPQLQGLKMGQVIFIPSLLIWIIFSLQDFHVYLTDFKAISNKLLRARRQKESVLKPKQSTWNMGYKGCCLALVV